MTAYVVVMILDSGGKVKCFVRGFIVDFVRCELARLGNLACQFGDQRRLSESGYAGLWCLFSLKAAGLSAHLDV